MLEPFAPRPDDTVELPAEPPRRQIALIVAAALMSVAVLVAVGLLAFGGLGNGGGGGGIQHPGLPAFSPGPGTASSAAPTPTTQPTTTPVAVQTPSGTPTAPIAINIANATMRPPSYKGSKCPGSTTGVATVVVKQPVTITYTWASADMAIGGLGTYTFTTAGSHQFSQPFTNIATPNGQVNATFAVISPVQRRASMVYTQKCGASVSDVRVALTPGAAGCPQFTATLRAGVGPMTVSYHWVVNGTRQKLHFWAVPAGGGHIAADLSAPAPIGATKEDATLVIDSPVATRSAQISVTC